MPLFTLEYFLVLEFKIPSLGFGYQEMIMSGSSNDQTLPFCKTIANAVCSQNNYILTVHKDNKFIIPEGNKAD